MKSDFPPLTSYPLNPSQDVWSPKYCGEGVPDWAADSGDVPPYAEPLAAPVATDPVTGYPKKCVLPYWGDAYLTFGACKAFQNFYDNEGGLMDAFADHWFEVASYFANNTNIIGYEILNEPWLGKLF